MLLLISALLAYLLLNNLLFYFLSVKKDQEENFSKKFIDFLSLSFLCLPMTLVILVELKIKNLKSKK